MSSYITAILIKYKKRYKILECEWKHGSGFMLSLQPDFQSLVLTTAGG
jgi:hypothetical protein